MSSKKREIVYCIVMGTVVLVLSLVCWCKPADAYSKTERRHLEQIPELSPETVLDGSFMADFESYTLDQFPFRDGFRSIKAVVQKYVFRQSDNNGVYEADGFLSKIDQTLSETALERAVYKFSSVYEKYLKDTQTKVFFSVIPDKNVFLADKNGYPAYDYGRLYQTMEEGLSDMTFIPISDLLEIGDYYRTDSHWKQECIVDVAECLRTAMGRETYPTAEYETNTLSVPFYGVYYGQAALPAKADTLTYLENETLSSCYVYDHENQRKIPMYDFLLAEGRDGYEMYLSGALSVITIENPNAADEKELVIFRDSFGSSIAPLLTEYYAKITLVDLRYLNENMLERFVDFTDQDILFLYSTSVLNNEASFR